MKELIRKHFDHGAQKYVGHALIQKIIALELLQKAVTHKTRGFSLKVPEILFNRCLDLGCGPGINYPELKQYAGSITGIDLSPLMIAEAKNLKISGTESLVADMENLNLPHKYDFIYSSLAMQWCSVERVLGRINMLKTADGTCTIAISLPTEGTLPELREAFAAVGISDRTVKFASAEKTAETAHRAFGKNIYTERLIFTDRHYDIKSYLVAIRDIGANTTSQPNTLSKSQYKELMIYLQKRLAAQGYLSHTYPVIFIYGTI